MAEPVGQFGDALAGLRGFIARMERRKLNRNTMAAIGVPANRRDGAAIAFEVMLGIFMGPRGFAQHVKTGGKTQIFAGLHALHRFIDGAAHHENLAHKLHRRAHALTHKGFAAAGDQPFQQTAFGIAQYRFAQHQSPGGAVDQNTRRFALMRPPIGIGQLVGDQQIGGAGIGHPQKCLGQR